MLFTDLRESRCGRGGFIRWQCNLVSLCWKMHLTQFAWSFYETKDGSKIQAWMWTPVKMHYFYHIIQKCIWIIFHKRKWTKVIYLRRKIFFFPLWNYFILRGYLTLQKVYFEFKSKMNILKLFWIIWSAINGFFSHFICSQRLIAY